MNWEIIDDKGVIHAGTEEEMRQAFSVATSSSVKELKDKLNISSVEAKNLFAKYNCRWTGDLKLVQVHAVHR